MELCIQWIKIYCQIPLHNLEFSCLSLVKATSACTSLVLRVKPSHSLATLDFMPAHSLNSRSLVYFCACAQSSKRIRTYVEITYASRACRCLAYRTINKTALNCCNASNNKKYSTFRTFLAVDCGEAKRSQEVYSGFMPFMIIMQNSTVLKITHSSSIKGILIAKCQQVNQLCEYKISSTH